MAVKGICQRFKVKNTLKEGKLKSVQETTKVSKEKNIGAFDMEREEQRERRKRRCDYEELREKQGNTSDCEGRKGSV